MSTSIQHTMDLSKSIQSVDVTRCSKTNYR